MKTTNTILFILLYFFSISCNKEHESKHAFIPTLRIVIPNNINEDPELFNKITKSEDLINKYSNSIETIACEGARLKKGDSESSIINGLEIAKNMLNFYSKDVQLQNTIEEFHEFIKTQKELKHISESQTETLIDIQNKFIHRVEILKHKYPMYYN